MATWNPLWASAISSNESSGRYNLVGPDNGKGNKPYGKYQVMDFNVGPWTKEAIGREMTPQEFLNDPATQDLVFRQQFGKNVDKYGSPQEAASVWFSGRPMAQAGNARDVLGTTVPGYVNKFDKALAAAGGDGVSAIDAAMGKQPQQPTGDVMAFAGNPPASTPPPDDGFMGALLSRIQGKSNGSNGTYDLGDALSGAGASMMALDNAKGAAVLAAMQSANRKADTKAAAPEWAIEPKSGVFYRTNPRTGQLETMKNPLASDEDKPKAKLNESALKNVGESMEKYDYLNQSASNASDILADLNKGTLDLGAMKNLVNSGKNVAGMSDEASRAYAKYNQFIQQLVNDNLRLNKGVQTEGDAYRELKSLQSNGTTYDNETAKEALKRIITKSQEAVLKRGTAYLDTHKKTYGDEPFAPYDEMAQGWKNNFENINGRLAAPAPSAAAPAAAPGGFRVIKGPH
jgi:hypothetical protein